MSKEIKLADSIRKVLNQASRESESGTPDHVLACYLLDSLKVFERAVRDRDAWWSHEPKIGGTVPAVDREETGKPEVWGNGCECWVTPEHMWTTHCGAVEPGSQVEYNPECPKHGGVRRRGDRNTSEQYEPAIRAAMEAEDCEMENVEVAPLVHGDAPDEYYRCATHDCAGDAASGHCAVVTGIVRAAYPVIREVIEHLKREAEAE